MTWMTYTLNDLLQVFTVPLPVGMADSANLVVVALRQNAAHCHLIGAHAAFGGLVQLGHILLDLLRVDWCRVFCSVGGENHHEVSFRFHAEVALHSCFQTLAEGLAVTLLDGLEIRVGASKQNIVEHGLLRTGTIHCIMKIVDIAHQGPSDELYQPVLEVTACLTLDVLNQVPLKVPLISIPDLDHLQWIFVGKYSDQSLFVGTKALHGTAEGMGIW